MSKFDDSNDDNNSADYSGDTCAPAIGRRQVLAERGPGGTGSELLCTNKFVLAVANRYLTSTHTAMASVPLQATMLRETEARKTAP